MDVHQISLVNQSDKNTHWRGKKLNKKILLHDIDISVYKRICIPELCAGWADFCVREFYALFDCAAELPVESGPCRAGPPVVYINEKEH